MKKIIKFESPSYDERETILNYDFVTKRWTIYSDVIKHVNKYKSIIDKSIDYSLGYNSKNELTMIKGTIVETALVSVRSQRKLTDVEKRKIYERLRKARINANKANPK